MAALQAAVGAAAVMLEGVWNQPQLLVEKDHSLDKFLKGGSKAQKVSEHTYRVTFQNALPGVRSAVYLDGSANFPAPGSPAWQEGFMQPVSYAVSVGWTQLAAITTNSDTLAVANVVDKTMTDAVDQLAITRDEAYCNGDGTGYWATISSVSLGAGGTYTLSSTDFGARNFGVGNNIDIYNGLAYVGTSNVTAVQDALGGTQILTVDNAVGAAADVIRFGGLVNGSPQFVYGLPYWNNNSSTGLTIGIDRTQAANNFILSPGVAAGGSSLTPPLFRLGLDQIIQAIGESAVSSGKFKMHMHLSQKAVYEQSGLSITNCMMADGKVPAGYDLLTTGNMSAAGNPFLMNIHANMSRVDFLYRDTWNSIKWGDSPFWFNDQGRTIFTQTGTNGLPTATFASFMIDTQQNFVSNPKTQCYISGLPEPVGY